MAVAVAVAVAVVVAVVVAVAVVVVVVVVVAVGMLVPVSLDLSLLPASAYSAHHDTSRSTTRISSPPTSTHLFPPHSGHGSPCAAIATVLQQSVQ